jgi:nucleotide-binding universal stress UspA family protein
VTASGPRRTRPWPGRAAVTELTGLRRALLRHLPGGSISTAATTGPPVWVLLQEAASAELLVVGAAGTDHPGPHLGAVAGTLAQRSPCPVLVVRTAVPVPAGAPVVVVVDEDPGTRLLLSAAMLAAVTRSTGLEVVPSRRTGDRAGTAALAALVEDLAATSPGVPVQLRPPVPRTVAALAREAHGAALLVIGRGDPDVHPDGPPLRAVLARTAASVLVVPLTRAPGRAPAPVRALSTPRGG